MRTTITLDSDVEALVKEAMAKRGIGFKRAVNDALRAGLRAAGRPTRFRQKTVDMGQPLVNLDKALSLSASLEDEEIIRKLNLGR